MTVGRRRDRSSGGLPPTAYVGFTPNPHLASFLARHVRERPYVAATDRYATPSFDHAIRTTKSSPIYALHAYHLGKKPHDAIEAYIEHFTEPGDLVLDPFAGSGSTALAALLCGRKAVAVDASPAATFITRYYVSPVDPSDFEARFHAMVGRVAEELSALYATECHRCGGPATLHYLIYSNTYSCPRCGREVSLYEALQDGAEPSCPDCRERGDSVRIHPGLGVRGCVPVAANVSCHGSCRPRRVTRSSTGSAGDAAAFDRIDQARIVELEATPIPHPVPQAFMMNVHKDNAPWGDEWRPSRDFRRVTELFTHRNLWALAALMHAAGEDLDLRALITSGMFAVSRKAQHLDGGGGYIPGNWALPPMSKQRNVVESLTRVMRRALRARSLVAARGPSREVCISTQSACELGSIPDGSVDYVFTDPPYGGAVQYAELNFVWEAWLGCDAVWHSDEIVVNHTRGLSQEQWAERLRTALAECHRVLKPGRYLSLCYHDVSGGTWESLQEAIKSAGFEHAPCETAVSIDTGGRTYNQYTLDKVTKRDLVINLRKPRPGEARLRSEPSTSDATEPYPRGSREIVRAFLRSHPGTTKDLVYDDLVAKLVRRGRMQTHDFEALLRDVGDEVVDGLPTKRRRGAPVGYWFVKKTGEPGAGSWEEPGERGDGKGHQE